MFRKIGNALRRFMHGRYGSDQFNMAILCTAVGLSLLQAILSMFLVGSWVYVRVISPLIYLLTLGLLGWNLFRCFSRSIYKRQQENRRFLNFFTRLKDRQHRYFRCPGCRQTVRVPRGKGKINIRCPKCGQRFVKKS